MADTRERRPADNGTASGSAQLQHDGNTAHPQESAADAPPAVNAAAVLARTDTRLVIVSCPHCRRRHVHGWPYGDTAPGLRESHCRYPTPHAAYVVLAPAGTG